MTPAAFKAVRERAGLTQSELSAWFGLSENGDRHIRAIENGGRRPSGPVEVLMNILAVALDALDDPAHEYHEPVVSLVEKGWLPLKRMNANG